MHCYGGMLRAWVVLGKKGAALKMQPAGATTPRPPKAGVKGARMSPRSPTAPILRRFVDQTCAA